MILLYYHIGISPVGKSGDFPGNASPTETPTEPKVHAVCVCVCVCVCARARARVCVYSYAFQLYMHGITPEAVVA